MCGGATDWFWSSAALIHCTACTILLPSPSLSHSSTCVAWGRKWCGATSFRGTPPHHSEFTEPKFPHLETVTWDQVMAETVKWGKNSRIATNQIFNSKWSSKMTHLSSRDRSVISPLESEWGFSLWWCMVEMASTHLRKDHAASANFLETADFGVLSHWATILTILKLLH